MLSITIPQPGTDYYPQISSQDTENDPKHSRYMEHKHVFLVKGEDNYVNPHLPEKTIIDNKFRPEHPEKVFNAE